jgi:hypothetical protein
MFWYIMYFGEMCILLLSSKTPQPTCVGEDLVKEEHLYTAGRNASWYNHSGKKFGDFLKI